MESLKIVLLCVVASIVYGIVHDQVTARVCVDYFSIGHPDLFGTSSPTLLAFGWGLVATWWVGLALGLSLAAAARAGDRPKLGWRELQRPVVTLMVVAAGCALISGVAGYGMARAGWVWLEGSFASDVPATRHAAFLAEI